VNGRTLFILVLVAFTAKYATTHAIMETAGYATATAIMMIVVTRIWRRLTRLKPPPLPENSGAEMR